MLQGVGVVTAAEQTFNKGASLGGFGRLWENFRDYTTSYHRNRSDPLPPLGQPW